MSKTVFDHEIFRIAHPVMQKLVAQEVQAKEFQVFFPHLYDYLGEIKKELCDKLSLILSKKHQENFDLSDPEIDDFVTKILFERNLLNHILGYCQTHELYLADEYLINDFLNHNEILDIFKDCHHFFWEKINAYDQLKNSKLPPSEFLATYLNNNNFHLPNLFPNWTIEQLFLDYLTIFIDYHKFSNTKATSEYTSKQPTAEEARLVLSRLFKYDSPLPAYNKSFINACSYDLHALSPEYLSLNIHLDENFNNLPSIINDFLHHLLARRLDHLRRGMNVAIPINEVQFHKIHQLRSQMDIVVNATSPLKRADTVLTSLISLIFYEQVFKSKVLDGDQISFQESNLTKILLDPNLKNSTLAAESLIFFDGRADYGTDQLMCKLYELLSNFKDVLISTEPKNAFPHNIKKIFCTNSRAPYSHKISKDSLNKTLPNTLELLSPYLAQVL